jgi:hypothetical protein
VEKPERKAEDDPGAVKTVAELAKLAAYVAQAWDIGGATYCTTKTWFGSGLVDAFARLASAENLSAAQRKAAEQDMIGAMPPCRGCGWPGASPQELELDRSMGTAHRSAARRQVPLPDCCESLDF